MDLSKIALIGVIVVVVTFGLLTVLGLMFAGPLGVVGLVVVGFFAVLFFGILNDRLKNREDDHYEKNVKD
ncbi:MAG: hypothetical protein GDA39_10745 [Hyphomonadaceae bacterium]|nr:hypothetical protein [Hyphomonadaceae bacterium]MBC6413294.1 hypothetical protein [Hyphomonadaceae bacterium]